MGYQGRFGNMGGKRWKGDYGISATEYGRERIDRNGRRKRKWCQSLRKERGRNTGGPR